MLQEHGLGARPYDCSKCTLKFFFRAELDHHVLTFHRPGEVSPPHEAVQNVVEMKAIDPEEQICDDGITVKEELLPDAAEEEEEINVDGQMEHEEDSKQVEANQKLKTEIDTEPAVSEKTES